MSGVSSEQRFTRSRPCPVCVGFDGQPRGQGVRCSGYTSSDGLYARCSRDEHARGIEPGPDGLYPHRRDGQCACGVAHDKLAAPAQPTRRRPQPAAHPATDTRYEVRSLDGVLQAVHVRIKDADGKGFVWERPDGQAGLGGRRVADLPLCGTERLAERTGEAVVVVEGEKAADALVARGVVAVGTVTGAGSCPGEAPLRVLRGHPVLLWPDNDDPGRTHMERVAGRLLALGHDDVRLVEWPDAPLKGDAADFAGDDEQLAALLATATPFAPKGAPNASTLDKVDVGAGKPSSVRLTWAREIAVRPIHWLWQDRLPLGALGLIGGREGLGKSTFAYRLVAEITRGFLPGAYFGRPKAVIIAATEDSWSRTIVPRLMAADADLNKVARVDIAAPNGTTGYLSLPRDVTELERLIVENDVALVLLDPLLSRLDANLDTHKDAEVRLALEPLVALADRAGASVLGLLHLNKGTSTDVLTLLMGSRAFPAVARSVLAFVRDPEDPSAILIGQAKNNLGRMNLPTLRVRVEEVHVADTEEGQVQASRTIPAGESEVSIDDAIAQVAGEDRTVVQEATEWLEDYLTSQGGSAPSSVIKARGKAAGHTDDALKRARERLRAPYASRGFPRETWWRLASANPVGAAVEESAPAAPTALTGK